METQTTEKSIESASQDQQQASQDTSATSDGMEVERPREMMLELELPGKSLYSVVQTLYKFSSAPEMSIKIKIPKETPHNIKRLVNRFGDRASRFYDQVDEMFAEADFEMLNAGPDDPNHPRLHNRLPRSTTLRHVNLESNPNPSPLGISVPDRCLTRSIDERQLESIGPNIKACPPGRSIPDGCPPPQRIPTPHPDSLL